MARACFTRSFLAGYGGALSIYLGISVRLQALVVSFFSVELSVNSFMNCSVITTPLFGGNVYGGSVSVYFGGYSSVYSANAQASIAVGSIVVRNISISMNNSIFASSSAIRSVPLDPPGSSSLGANAYGGSFSFYIGAFVWCLGNFGNIICSSGLTIVTGLSISVFNTTSSNCIAATLSNTSIPAQQATASTGGGLAESSNGANSFGGSMSLVYIGPYVWSLNNGSGGSNSYVDTVNATDVAVVLSTASCTNCSAVSMTSGNGGSNGANVIGGAISVMYVGGYAWSQSSGTSSNSTAAVVIAKGLIANLSNIVASSCSALSSTSGDGVNSGSNGANTVGGCLSIVWIGSYTWSDSAVSLSDATEGTMAADLVVWVNNANFSNCQAKTTVPTINGSGGTNGASSFGGAINVIYVGSYAWSQSYSATGIATSLGGSSIGSKFKVSVINTTMSNCEAVSVTLGQDFVFSGSASSKVSSSDIQTNSLSSGANAYGGGISVAYIGAYAWSFANSGGSSSSIIGDTNASDLSIHVGQVSSSNCSAVTITDGGLGSSGASAYGGSISVVQLSAFAWTYSFGGLLSVSKSSCQKTTAIRLNVSINNLSLAHSLALSRTLCIAVDDSITENIHTICAETKRSSSQGANVRSSFSLLIS